MSAPGGGGGRRLPIYIDLILTGSPQVISGVNATLGQIRGSASAAVGPVNQLGQAFTTVGSNAQAANAGLTSAAAGGRALGGAFQGLGGTISSTGAQFRNLDGSLTNTARAASGVVAGVNPLAGALNNTTAATNTLSSGLGRGAAAWQTFMSSGRGAGFAITGLVGSMNEAVFMSGRLADAQTRVNEAQAEVNRLAAAGAQGTAEYSRAQQELDQALRGLNFTQRITTQSWLDNITFIGMLASQIPRIVSEYRSLRTGVEGVSSSLNLKARIMQGLTGIFGQYTPALTGINTAQNAATAGIQRFTAEGTRLQGAFRGIQTSATPLQGALTGTAAGFTAASGAAASGAPFFTRAGQTIANVAPAATAATGGLRAFAAAAAPIAIVLGPIIGLSLALQNNWFGLRDSAVQLSQTLRDNAAAYGPLAPLVRAYADANDGLRTALGGATAEEQRSTDAKARLSQEISNLVPRIQEAAGAALGLGESWQTTADNTIQLLTGMAQAGNTMANGLIDAMQRVNAQLVANPGNQALAELSLAMDQAAGQFVTAGAQMQAAMNLVAVDGATKLGYLQLAVKNAASAFATLPTEVQEDITSVVDAIDLGIEGVNKFPISAQEAAEIIDGVMDGRIVPAMRKLPPEVQQNIIAAMKWAQAQEHPEHALNQVAIAITQGLIPALQYETGATEEAAASLTPYTTAIAAAAEEAGILTVVTNDNAAIIGKQVALINDEARAREQQAAHAEAVREALMGLNMESQSSLAINQDIITGITEQGQAYNELNVATAAQAAGMQTWRDTLAQAHFDIVETATALGYMGDTSVAAAGQMLQFTAAAEKQNEVNAQGVETYFNLSAAAQENLTTMGISADMMGQVAAKREDLTAAEAEAIQIMAQIDQGTQRNIEGRARLAEATDGVNVSMETMNAVMALSETEVARLVATLDAGHVSFIANAEAAEANAAAIGGMVPAVQELADGYGLMFEAGQKVEPWMTRTVGHLEQLSSQYVTAVGEAEAFAIQHGTAIPTAAQAFDAAMNGNLTPMINMISGLTELESATTSTAETIQQESERIAEAWQAGLDKTIEATDAWNENMKSAFETVGAELGEEMKGIGTKVKEDFSAGIAFNAEFWNKAFPEGVARASFEENVDIEGLIEDTQKFIDSAVEEGLISREDADRWFKPLIDFMENELPDNTEQAFGVLVGRMPSMMAQLTPVIVNGIEVAGGEARAAVDTSIVQPWIQALQQLPQGASGIDLAGPLVQMVQAAIPGFSGELEALGGVFIGALQGMAGNSQAQVQAIIDVIRQIDPAFADMIMAIDQDADQIPDIMDSKILSPFDQMKVAMLEGIKHMVDAFALYFESIGNTEAAEAFRQQSAAIQASIDGITTSTEALTPALQQLKDENAFLASQFGLTASEIDNLRTSFDGFNTSTGAGVKLADEFILSLNGMSAAERQAAIDFYEMTTGVDLFADGLEIAGTAVTDTGIALDEFGRVAERAVIPWEHLTQAERIAVLNGMPPPVYEVGDALRGMETAAAGALVPWDELTQEQKIAVLNGAPRPVRDTAEAVADLGTAAAGANPAWAEMTKEERINALNGAPQPLRDTAAAMTDVGTAADSSAPKTGALLEGIRIFARDIGPALGYVSDAIARWMSAVDGMWAAWKPWEHVNAAFGSMIMARIGPSLATFWTGIETWIGSVNELFGTLGGGAGGGGGSVFEPFYQRVSEVPTKMQQYLDPGLTIATQWVEDLGQAFGQEGWGQQLQGWLDSWQSPDGPVQGPPSRGMEAIRQFLNEKIPGLGDLFAANQGAITEPVNTIFGPGGLIVNDMGGWVEPAKAQVQSGIDQIKGLFQTGWGGGQGPGGFQGLGGGNIPIGEGLEGQQPPGGEGAGGAMAGFVIPPPDTSQFIAAIQQLVTDVQTNLATMELAWTNQLANNGAQITAFVSGPLAMLANAYVQYQTNVVPILQQMELAWTNHLANNGTQITAFVSGPLAMLANAYVQYQTNVVPIIQAMELAWTNHLANTGTQMTTFITGPLTTLAQAYTLFQSNVVPIIAAMELAWTNHLANTGVQMTTFITGPLTTLATAYTLFQTNVVPIIAAMELAWTTHLTNTGAQMTAFITGPLTTLAQAYTLYQTNVVPIIAAIELAWTTHLTNTGAQITAFVTGPLTQLAAAYLTMQTNVHTALEAANQFWAAHAAHIAAMVAQIAASIGESTGHYTQYSAGIHTQLETANQNWAAHQQHVADMIAQIAASLAESTGQYEQYASDVHANLEENNQNWQAHADHVTEMVSGPITQAIEEYIAQMEQLLQSVQQTLEEMTQAWEQHAQAVEEQVSGPITNAVDDYITLVDQAAGEIAASLEEASGAWEDHAAVVEDMASAAGDAVDQLASDVASAMSSIQSDMDAAADSARDLKSAIDALESKTITVTTNYVTNGSPPNGGAAGFHGVVSQPTKITVGEGNLPEFVSITPLAGNGRNSQRVGIAGSTVSGGSTDGTLHIPTRTPNVRTSVDIPHGDARVEGLKQVPALMMNFADGLSPIDIEAIKRKAGIGEPPPADARAIIEETWRRIEAAMPPPETQPGPPAPPVPPTEPVPPTTPPGTPPPPTTPPPTTEPTGPTPEEEADAERKRLEEELIKLLESRKQQIEEIMQAMSSVQRQVGLQVDLFSDAEMEKWVATVMPKLSDVPISMHYSSVRAMPIRSRYQQHKTGMINMRKSLIEWLQQERERQLEQARKIEEERARVLAEYEQYIEQHGTELQKQALAAQRAAEAEAYKKSLLQFNQKYGPALNYSRMVGNYYDSLYNSVPPITTTKPAPPPTAGVPATKRAQHGFHGIVAKATQFTVGEGGRPEQVDITPIRDAARTRADEIRSEVRHFVGQLMTQVGNAGAAGRARAGEARAIEVTIPVTTELNGKVMSRELRKYLIDGVSSMR